jgi:ketosteroid isomerase-like protein
MASNPLALTSPIARFFEASNQQDAPAMLACFAKNATVVDEAVMRSGTVAIRRWIKDSTAKYQASVEPLDQKHAGDETVVTGMVTGNFDGSPAPLTYNFRLAGQTIAYLKITA